MLSSDSSITVTAASGVLKSAYGIVGMAGVGKTVALRGLAYVRTRFPDGVPYMTLWSRRQSAFGASRTVEHPVRIRGTHNCRNSERFHTLREAVDAAVLWFQGRVCLFLVDDLWPTKTYKTCFLLDLRQLLRDSPASPMAISTRSIDIAECAGAVVQFGAREPFSTVSLNIFMAHVTRGASG